MKFSLSYLIVTIAFSAPSLFAQDYAVTTKGDTLRGEIKILTYDIQDRLQVSANGKKTTYTSLQVKEFMFDKQPYRTIKRENAYRFMKLVKPGYLSLFAFRMDNQTSYDGRFLVKKDASSMEVPNLTFKKSMMSFLGDCPSVSEKIKEGEYSKRDVDKIIDLYNACIEQKTQQIKENAPPVTTNASNGKLTTLEAFTKKVESTPDFPSKKDALDLLKDIHSKVSRNETIPNYLIEGLKSYFTNQLTLSEDAEKTIASLKK